MKLTKKFLLDENVNIQNMKKIPKTTFKNMHKNNEVLLIPIDFGEISTEELYNKVQKATGDAIPIGKPVTRLDMTADDTVYTFNNKYNTYYLVRTETDFSKSRNTSRTDTVISHILYVKK